MLSALKTGGVTVELNEVHNVLIEVINFYEQKNLVNKYWLYSCQKKKKYWLYNVIDEALL